jgi:hypothetical protein
MWYQQVKLGGDAGESKPGAEGDWVFYMYAFRKLYPNRRRRL